MTITALNSDIFTLHDADSFEAPTKDFYFMENNGNTFLVQKEDDLFTGMVVHSGTEDLAHFDDKVSHIENCAWYSLTNPVHCTTMQDVWSLLCEAEENLEG